MAYDGRTATARVCGAYETEHGALTAVSPLLHDSGVTTAVIAPAFAHGTPLPTAPVCGGLPTVGLAMERTTQALRQADLLSAERVITGHDHLGAHMRTHAEE